MRYKLEKNMMMNKLFLAGILCLMMGTTGCISQKSYLQEECEDGICTRNEEYTAVCIENEDGYSECNDTSDVNYTRTAAKFRQYGERSPRDYRITQAGAGNNISATIPPSIDDEVLDYETEMGYAANGDVIPAGVTDSSGNNVSNGNINFVNSYSNNMSSSKDNSSSYDLNNSQKESSSDTSEEEDQNKDWLAEEGQSLKQLLTQWSEEAGWRLIWKTNRNYTLNAGAMFRGNFADVSSALVRAFARARPAPIATFYKGNRVLVIETMEDENAYD